MAHQGVQRYLLHVGRNGEVSQEVKRKAREIRGVLQYGAVFDVRQSSLREYIGSERCGYSIASSLFPYTSKCSSNAIRISKE